MPGTVVLRQHLVGVRRRELALQRVAGGDRRRPVEHLLPVRPRRSTRRSRPAARCTRSGRGRRATVQRCLSSSGAVKNSRSMAYAVSSRSSDRSWRVYTNPVSRLRRTPSTTARRCVPSPRSKASRSTSRISLTGAPSPMRGVRLSGGAPVSEDRADGSLARRLARSRLLTPVHGHPRYCHRDASRSARGRRRRGRRWCGENGREPKNPLWADSGDGCADSITVWRGGVDERLLAPGVAAPQDEHDAVVLGGSPHRSPRR